MSEIQKSHTLQISSYDLIKTFAVIIMIIDHIGAYFYPEALWWRAIGRIGFPIWFFLVGYARGRDLSIKLIVGASVLVLANYIVGMPVFPLNALMTIMTIRVLIEPLMKKIFFDSKKIWLVSGLFFLIAIPTYYLTEYGTLALIFAIFGYCVRNKERIKDTEFIMNYMIFSFLAFAIVQFLTFGFSVYELVFMSAGTLSVCFFLRNFNPANYTFISKKYRHSVVVFLKFCGHRTLEIYVVHLLMFKGLALWWGFEGFDLLTFRLFPS